MIFLGVKVGAIFGLESSTDAKGDMVNFEITCLEGMKLESEELEELD